LSDNVENIYKPSYQNSFLIETEKYKNNIIKINNIDLNDYRQKMFPWKYKNNQLELMIKYKI
jgi:sulfate adenylyltransferase subunit 1 (EFTu-like GTPase family)